MRWPRYLLLLPKHPEQAALPTQVDVALLERTGIRSVTSLDHVHLFANDDAPVQIYKSGSAVLIGTAFNRTYQLMDDPRFLKTYGDDPAGFLDDYWGAYIALFRPEAGTAVLARDAGGMFPCYYCDTPAWIAVASDLATLRLAGFAGHVVDWMELARHLRAPDYRTMRTSIANVVELDPGTSLVMKHDRTEVAQLWSPWVFADADAQYPTPEEAIAQIRDITIGVVGAWATRASHIVVELSGGLDSSIVAASIKESGRDFSCATYATHDYQGDERLQARAVSDRVGAHLFEAFVDARDVDLTRSEAAHLPRPVARAFEQAVDLVNITAADASGADMFMHGGGGDNVFCYLQSTSPVIDRLRREGRGRGVWHTLDDICDVTGCSVWQALDQVVRRWAAPKPIYRWTEDQRFLGLAAELVEQHDHPWFLSAGDMVPGKLGHAALLLRIRNGVEAIGRQRRAPVVGPLLSQPLVEACLRVPSWWWCEGGRNRAIARAAFAGLLPPQTLARRTKGTPDGFAARLFDARRQEIAELLLDGILASRQLIDPKALEIALRSPAPLKGNDYIRILTLVDVEAWVRAQLSP